MLHKTLKSCLNCRMFLMLAVLFIFMPGCSKPTNESSTSGEKKGLKKAKFSLRADGPKSIDPIRGSTTYENECASQVFETLLQYKYLKRPFELEPLLLSEMPVVSDDGLTWKFKLKKGVFFHDDPCFPDGKGRELVASDVIYSWKRMADISAKSKVFWLVENTIQGFDEYKATQEADGTFDYSVEVPGLKVLNDLEFEVVLKKAATRFQWTLAMFQMAVVPREAVEKYGQKFGLHPVGTGPFILKEEDWQQGVKMTFRRNPNYHQCFFPSEAMPEDADLGVADVEGKRLPFLDEVQLEFIQQDQPLWLKFSKGNLDYCQLPDPYYEEIFSKRTRKMLPAAKKKGLTAAPVPLLDFIFRGFNMEDSVVGGYTEEKRALRQAISLALDWDEQNETFYSGQCLVYDGPVPSGIEGYPEGGVHSNSKRGLDLERARELMVKAGYPEGKGLPRIEYYTSRAQNGKQQSEMITRQLSAIGIDLKVVLLDFSTLIQKLDDKNGQMFSFAWGSDYPDAENNLSVFYGPNESPGNNHFNYKNAEYDKLYEQIAGMPSSDARNKIIDQMIGMLLEDCPYAGSMARTRNYVVHSRLKYFKPVETFSNWYKYVDVMDE